VRFVGTPLTPSFLALHLGRCTLWRLLWIHRLTGLLLVAWRRRPVLARLLLALRRVLIALLLWLLLVVGQRLSVRTFCSVSQECARVKRVLQSLP
jgi:hypothetical protein